MQTETIDKPKCAVILLNIVKDSNFGRILRTADALGACEIIVVGKKRFNMTGHMGADIGRNRRHFHTMDDAAIYLRQQGFQIIGIEITDNALPVETQPFSGDTAFLLGNEGIGILDVHRNYCDSFVYIRQFGLSASLNVNVAAGIVLHQFSNWAGYQENPIEGEKFVGSRGLR